MSHRHPHKHEGNPSDSHAEHIDSSSEPNHCEEMAGNQQAKPEKQMEAESQSVEMGNSLKTVEKLKADLAKANDQVLRCQAELDNYRKRSSRETEDRLRYANIELMRDLLPVWDNIHRAVESAEKSSEASALLDGVKLVAQQFEDVLKRHNCLKIEALHTPFDPNMHHAILQQPSEEHPENTVIMITQDGFQLHDRVVRPTQVIVSTAKKE